MLIVCNSGEDPAREQRHLDMLEEQRVQGLLITPVVGRRPAPARPLRRARHPGRARRPRCRRAPAGARSPSTTCSAAGWPPTTCSNAGTATSRSSAVRCRSGRWPTGTAAPRTRWPASAASLTLFRTPHLSIDAGRAAAANLAALPDGHRPTAVVLRQRPARARRAAGRDRATACASRRTSRSSATTTSSSPPRPPCRCRRCASRANCSAARPPSCWPRRWPSDRRDGARAPPRGVPARAGGAPLQRERARERARARLNRCNLSDRRARR